MRNTRSLLLCSIASELEGDRERSAELEEWARRVQHEGFERAFLAPELRLAIVRGDLEHVERLVGSSRGIIGPTWFGLTGMIARLDGLVALGRREEVEELVREGFAPGTLLDAVGLRALGAVREDEALLRQALERSRLWASSGTRPRRGG
jgi:hypothetical protein